MKCAVEKVIKKKHKPTLCYKDLQACFVYSVMTVMEFQAGKIQ